MREIKRNAYAKVNLSLDIVGRREDGYHLLRSVMQQIGIYDTVTLREAEEGISLKIAIEGQGGELLPADESNLAWKAADKILKASGCKKGVEIVLQKRIPIAAGLAGGSTDAAAVLMGINELYHLGYRMEELCQIGASFGADIPFCILGGTALVEGIGDKLTVLPFAGKFTLLLAKPVAAVSTAEIYRGFDEKAEHKGKTETEGILALLAEGNADAAGLSACMGNDLAEITEALHPEIIRIREAMLREGAAGAMMSGSGPSVFGLFADAVQAEKAKETISREFPEIYLAVTAFSEGNL